MMARGFFSRFKGHFDSDLGGRYISAIVVELINELPHITLPALDLDELKQGHHYAKLEQSFQSLSDKRARRSDACVFDATHRLSAVIEVKDEDQHLSSVPAQLRDYVEMCRKQRIPFVYLTRYPISKAQDAELKKYRGARALQLHQLANRLAGYVEGEQLVRMFVQFMQEGGGMFTEDINESALKYLLAKSLAFPHAHGFGKLLAEDRITTVVPQTLQQLFTNTSIVADRLYRTVFINSSSVKRAPSVGGFFIRPHISATKVRALSKKDEDEFDIAEQIESGRYFVWASLKIGSIWMDFGYCFDVKRGGLKSASSVKMYAYTYIRHKKVDSQSDLLLNSFKEDPYFSGCLKTMRNAIDEIVKDNELNKTARRELIKLRPFIVRELRR